MEGFAISLEWAKLEFTVTNGGELDIPEDTVVRCNLSRPIPINLPSQGRTLAGIPEDANYVSFAYPARLRPRTLNNVHTEFLGTGASELAQEKIEGGYVVRVAVVPTSQGPSRCAPFLDMIFQFRFVD